MAQQSNGRHRKDVEVNVLESMELRSRRSIREAESKRKTRQAKREARRAAKVQLVFEIEAAEALGTSRSVVAAQPKIKFSKRKGVRNAVAMLFAGGMFTTVALPSYAFSPDVAAMARFTTTNAAALSAIDSTQGLTVLSLIHI